MEQKNWIPIVHDLTLKLKVFDNIDFPHTFWCKIYMPTSITSSYISGMLEFNLFGIPYVSIKCVFINMNLMNHDVHTFQAINFWYVTWTYSTNSWLWHKDTLHVKLLGWFTCHVVLPFLYKFQVWCHITKFDTTRTLQRSFFTCSSLN